MTTSRLRPWGIMAWLTGLLALFHFHVARAQLTVTTADQQGALPLTPAWIPAADSVIAGLPPSSSAGNFSEEAAGRNVDSLTAAGSLTIGGISGNTTSTNYVTCGNDGGAGAFVVYTLPAATNGWNLTNITVYGGWKDNGRDQQAYTVYYARAVAPSNFVSLASVSYLPAVPGGTGAGARSKCRRWRRQANGFLIVIPLRRRPRWWRWTTGRGRGG